MKIENNRKLVIIGDSITDCGRTRPVGEGLFDAEGTGYVKYIKGLLGSVYPEKHIRVVNMGNSGNTVRDLDKRWKTDVYDLNPDWIAIMIGINDVWRQFDLPMQTECHVYIDEYEATLEKLIKETLPKVKGMILMTPYFIELNRGDAMRAMMDRYGLVVKKLAEKYGTYYVDTQKAFDKILEHCHPGAIAWDRVHPNSIGHMALAKAFLNAVEFEW